MGGSRSHRRCSQLIATYTAESLGVPNRGRLKKEHSHEAELQFNCIGGAIYVGVSLVALAHSANAQASSDGSGVVAGQAKSGEPTSGAGRK